MINPYAYAKKLYWRLKKAAVPFEGQQLFLLRHFFAKNQQLTSFAQIRTFPRESIIYARGAVIRLLHLTVAIPKRTGCEYIAEYP